MEFFFQIDLEFIDNALHLMYNEGVNEMVFWLFAFQALEALLELSAPSFEQCRDGGYLNNSVNYKEDIRFLIERKDSVSDIILLLDFFLESLCKGSYFDLFQ